MAMDDLIEAEWYHVVPVNDQIEHNTKSRECDCQPRLDHDSRLVVHNALDNREFDEIAELMENESK